MAGIQRTVLRYPIEETDYRATVTFTPVIEPPVEVSLLRSSTNNEQPEDETLNGEQSEVQNVRVTGQVKDGDRSCTLFLPASINIADGARYNNVSLGILGAGAEAAISGGASALSGVMSAGKGGIDSFIDSFKSGGAASDTAKLVANRVAGLAGDEIQGAVKSQTRVTTNPNIRALFESVPLREFQFTFKMIPQSADENKMIKEIVNFFRTELYPEEIVAGLPGEDVSFSIGYKFPNKIRIDMTYTDRQGRDIELATKIHPSYLTSVNVTYNASSMGMHSDGGFTEVDISLSFLEPKALSKQDIGLGF